MTQSNVFCDFLKTNNCFHDLFCPGCYHFFKSLTSDAEKGKFDDVEAGPTFARARLVRLTFETRSNSINASTKELIATVMRKQAEKKCPEDVKKLFQRLKYDNGISTSTSKAILGNLDKERLKAKSD